MAKDKASYRLTLAHRKWPSVASATTHQAVGRCPKWVNLAISTMSAVSPLCPPILTVKADIEDRQLGVNCGHFAQLPTRRVPQIEVKCLIRLPRRRWPAALVVR